VSTHPSHDDELLNDFLDGRLGEVERQALSHRLEREPALREAYEELLRSSELFRAGPDPEPPADFTARVRARIDAEEAGDDPVRAASGSSSDARPSALAASEQPGRHRLEHARGGAHAPEVPRAWRRLMVAAYASAALLMVAIGVVSLRRGARNDASAPEGAALETATAKDGALLNLEDERARLARDERNAKRDKAAGEKKLGDALRAGDLKSLGELKAVDEAGPSSGAGAGGGARGGRPAPRIAGPGGSVPPGLREPSDAAPLAAGTPAPEPAPAAPVPAPAKPPAASAPAPGLAAPSANPPVVERAARATPKESDAFVPEPVVNVLVLEARTADEGRALVRRVLAGPAAPAADDEGGGFTTVSLRRADRKVDAVLLARLALAGGAQPKSLPTPTPPSAPPPSSVPPSYGPTPTSPAAERPAPQGPAASPQADAPGSGREPLILADYWQELTAEQRARLEALLGPLPAPAVPTGGGGGAPAPAPGPAPAPAPTTPSRVRFVITSSR